MRHSRSRRTLKLVSLSLAAFVADLAATAETAPLPAAPDYPGIELPLRPGERVVPTAGGNCSVIVFAPHE